MITIAVAGGSSSGLGRSIVRAIQQYPDQLRAVVLSRQSSKVPAWLEETGIEVRKVDYSSEDSLYDALQGIHTVLCVILAADGTWVSSQINLLRAGLRAGISRFAPAEFGVGPQAADNVTLLQPGREVMAACREAKKKTPDFEYAGFHVGLFMNYLGYGAPDEAAATHEMNDTWVFVWDVKNMKAAIPLTKEGEVPHMTMTELGDVGRFAAAACLLPQGSWKEDFSLASETLRMDKVVQIIEKVRGKKMNVTYRKYEEIEKEEAEVDVSNVSKLLWLQIELLASRNAVGEGIVEPILNKLCPSVKPMSVEEYMKKFWS
ncbi:hypothetical protein BKA66DRAFT_474373 [Pyrenochaeta sp. MPI-SDFR-AT-0127]|nr:hypothetical protein BKA66DRAFT_474373 [Pyrenochaeta sp. MPI-SDFR-AT-0127]